MPEFRLSPIVSQMIEQQLATGRFRDEEDVLQSALRKLSDEFDDWPEIKQALDALDAGESGLPLQDAILEVRRRHSLEG